MEQNFFKTLSYEEVGSFGKDQRNRVVNEIHVNDFYNVIKNGRSRVDLGDGTYLVLGILPVIVNPKTNHILEGQHRIAAFKKAHEKGDIDDNARIMVGYWRIEDDELENLITIDLNSNTKNWSLDDYMTSYAKYKTYYTQLRDFVQTHELCRVPTRKGDRLKYRYAAAMITGKGCQTALKAGTLTFTPEQLKLADTIHRELVEIRKKLGMPATGDEIEYMATEWYVQRNFISVADIKSLTYLPKSVTEKKIYNKADWREVFSILKDCVGKKQLKMAA